MRSLAAIAAIFLLISSPTAAQSVSSSGTFTPGHAIRAATAGSSGVVVTDAGGSAGSAVAGSGYLTELGITATGTPLCINDALTNASTGYHQLCLGASSGGGGVISFNAFGGASTTALQININGTNYPFPGAANLWVAGNQTGLNPWLKWLIEQIPGDLSAFLHGVYVHNTSSYLGFSGAIAAADDPTNANADSPRNILSVFGTNNGSVAPLVPLWAASNCKVTGALCYGANISAYGLAGAITPKLFGLEIDLAFGAGNSVGAGSGALFINTFNVAKTGPAIQINGVSSGTFTNGVMIGGVASDGTMLGNLGAGTANSFLNTSNGNYTTAAIIIANNNGTGYTLGSNNQVIDFAPASGNATVAAMNASNNFILQNGGASNYFITTTSGSQYFGTTTPLANAATAGFVFLPSMSGAPTGVPANIPNWANPVVIDTLNNKMCFYTTAWKCVAFI